MEITETPTSQAELNIGVQLERLTVAHGLFALILVGAAVMRLTALGSIPLSNDEAREALAVWQFWHVAGETTTTSSPAYFFLTALLTPVLGFSDATMRLVPALVGLGVVALPWWLRPQLGTVGALVTSTLLAASPLATATARTAGGDSVALFAALLLVVGILRYWQTAVSHWFYVAAVAVALGLASSPLFYTAVASLALVALLARLTDTKPVQVTWPWPSPDLTTWRHGMALAAVTLVAVSTLFLTYPAGIGAVAEIPAQWLAQFSLQGTRAPLFTPLAAIVRYELILLPLGLIAVGWLILQDEPMGNLSIFWLTGLVVLLVLQRGVVTNASLVVLPGYLLLGLLLQRSAPRLGDLPVWALAAVLVILGLVGAVNLARFLRQIAFSSQDLGSLWFTLLALVFALLTIYFVMSRNQHSALAGTTLGLLFFFLLYQWGTAWWLGHVTANDPRETWVTSATQDDVRNLAELLAEVSQQAENAPAELAIFSSVDNAALRWYLRDFARLEVGDTAPVNTTRPAVITPDGADPAFGSDYFGADFGLTTNGLNSSATESGRFVLNTLRWWLFHDQSAVPATVDEQRVILWLRADVGAGEIGD